MCRYGAVSVWGLCEYVVLHFWKGIWGHFAISVWGLCEYGVCVSMLCCVFGREYGGILLSLCGVCVSMCCLCLCHNLFNGDSLFNVVSCVYMWMCGDHLIFIGTNIGCKFYFCRDVL